MTLRSLLVACSVIMGMPVAGASAAPATSVTVFASSSLQSAFETMAKRFEAAHPGTRIVLNLAGSQQLAAQLALGAEGDVFASADERWMEDVRQRGLLASDPVVFAHNTIVVIVPKKNAARIASLQDLARPRVQLAMALESVPAGRYSRDALAMMSSLPGFPPQYATRVIENVVTEEENVKAVVAKVQLGEVDAGFVYASDVTPSLARVVRVFTLPQAARTRAHYPIALLRTSHSNRWAKAFVDLVRSPEGQRILEQHGFRPLARP